MPTVMHHLQKTFALVMNDDMPQATVKLVDQRDWLMCCPLCGCMHQILRIDVSQPYTPMCQSIPALYKTQQDAWRKLHPDVIKYTALRLVKDVSQ